MEGENQPLLQTFSSNPRRRYICQRIPFEVTVTGAILGLFLVVVTLLIVFENLKTSSDNQLVIAKDLLSSSLQNIKNPHASSLQAKKPEVTLLKKSKYTEDGYTEKYNDSPQKHKTVLKKKVSSGDGGDFKKQHEFSTESYTDSSKGYEYILKLRKQSIIDKLSYIKNRIKDWKNDLLKGDGFEENFNEKDEEVLNDLLEKPLDSGETSDDPEIAILGSPFKYNKKSLDKSGQNKKDEYANFKKNFKNNKVDENWKEFQKGSSLNYNKKDYVSQDKKKNIIDSKKSFNNYKWDNVDKGWKKLLQSEPLSNSADKSDAPEIALLGSAFSYNKKEFDDTWIKKKEDILKFKKDFLNKWGKSWDKFQTEPLLNSADKSDAPEIALLGSAFSYNKKGFDDTWIKKKQDILQFKKDFLNKWGKSRDKFQTGVAPHSGCPLKSAESSSADSALMQSYVDCAHLVEDMQKEYGKCIDLTFLPKECKPSWRTKCFSTYKYRKIDDSCNNRIHPTWGSSGFPFVRMIAPDYADGSASLRISKTGDALPNARLLSQKLYSKPMKKDIDTSMLFLFFGLFVDHDMVETAQNSGSIPCCDEYFENMPENRPKECLQIDIPYDDPFYGPRNVSCLNLVRSVPVQGECIGRREQLNKATSFLDGSAIYGSTMSRAKALRAFNRGQLKTVRINDSPYMSYSDKASYTCGTPSEPLKCFAAGDSRANMLVDLTAMHTVWYREHNRIAEELHNLNPQWIDETLYQEARRIVIAELQHIAYNEFLPVLLGDKAMEYFELNVNEGKDYEGYDETVDPSVFNVFGAAAFRFGHSLAQDVINLIGSDNAPEGEVPLHDTFFNLHLLYHNGLDLLLRGAASQKIHSVDSYMTKEMHERLFQPTDKDYGQDLGAIGIQRGRDHGLPSYTKWRSVCGLSEIQSWEDLNEIMNPERARKLKEVYEDIEDIDLVPAALAENHVEGSLLGPTYLCLISRQFRKTRKGDRFWYEEQKNIGSFTKDQLGEIYHASMARIVCDNSDDIQRIQIYAFKIPSENNSVVDCEDIPRVDLKQWEM